MARETQSRRSAPSAPQTAGPVVRSQVTPRPVPQAANPLAGAGAGAAQLGDRLSQLGASFNQFFGVLSQSAMTLAGQAHRENLQEIDYQNQLQRRRGVADALSGISREEFIAANPEALTDRDLLDAFDDMRGRTLGMEFGGDLAQEIVQLGPEADAFEYLNERIRQEVGAGTGNHIFDAAFAEGTMRVADNAIAAHKRAQTQAAMWAQQDALRQEVASLIQTGDFDLYRFREAMTKADTVFFHEPGRGRAEVVRAALKAAKGTGGREGLSQILNVLSEPGFRVDPDSGLSQSWADLFPDAYSAVQEEALGAWTTLHSIEAQDALDRSWLGLQDAMREGDVHGANTALAELLRTHNRYGGPPGWFRDRLDAHKDWLFQHAQQAHLQSVADAFFNGDLSPQQVQQNGIDPRKLVEQIPGMMGRMSLLDPETGEHIGLNWLDHPTAVTPDGQPVDTAATAAGLYLRAGGLDPRTKEITSNALLSGTPTRMSGAYAFFRELYRRSPDFLMNELDADTGQMFLAMQREFAYSDAPIEVVAEKVRKASEAGHLRQAGELTLNRVYETPTVGEAQTKFEADMRKALAERFGMWQSELVVNGADPVFKDLTRIFKQSYLQNQALGAANPIANAVQDTARLATKLVPVPSYDGRFTLGTRDDLPTAAVNPDGTVEDVWWPTHSLTRPGAAGPVSTIEQYRRDLREMREITGLVPHARDVRLAPNPLFTRDTGAYQIMIRDEDGSEAPLAIAVGMEISDPDGPQAGLFEALWRARLGIGAVMPLVGAVRLPGAVAEEMRRRPPIRIVADTDDAGDAEIRISDALSALEDRLPDRVVFRAAEISGGLVYYGGYRMGADDDLPTVDQLARGWRMPTPQEPTEDELLRMRGF